MVTTISEGRVRNCDNMTWDMGQGEGFKAITVLGKCESFCETSGAQNYRHFLKTNMHFRFALDFRLH